MLTLSQKAVLFNLAISRPSGHLDFFLFATSINTFSIGHLQLQSRIAFEGVGTDRAYSVNIHRNVNAKKTTASEPWKALDLDLDAIPKSTARATSMTVRSTVSGSAST